MSGQQPRILCDRAMGAAKASASTQAGDWNDVIGHHRYYGSSAISGEPMAETRRGSRPRALNVFRI
jgi:hypothetical protein